MDSAGLEAKIQKFSRRSFMGIYYNVREIAVMKHIMIYLVF